MIEELFNQFGWKVTLEEASLPDGRVKKAARVERCDSVHVIAESKPGHVLMLREFRPFYQKHIWMIPSGKVDKEDDINVAAQRELQEETGFRANAIQPWCKVNNSDAIKITNHIFIAKNLEKDPLPQDATEMIELHELPIEEAIEKVLTSPYIHTVSAFALMRYAREKNR